MLNPQTSAHSQTFARSESAIRCVRFVFHLLQRASNGANEASAKLLQLLLQTPPTTPVGGGGELKQKQRGVETERGNRVSASTQLKHAKNNTLEEPASFCTIGGRA
jgi:hypothetical protein